MMSSGIPRVGTEDESEVIVAQVSVAKSGRRIREALFWLRGFLGWVYLTQQLAELVVSLLGLNFPFSSEGHFGGVGGWRCESRDAEPSWEASKVLRCRLFPVYILYTSRHLPHLHVVTQESNYSWGWWLQRATRERAITCINGRLWSSLAVSKCWQRIRVSWQLTLRSLNSPAIALWSHSTLLLQQSLNWNKGLPYKI